MAPCCPTAHPARPMTTGTGTSRSGIRQLIARASRDALRPETCVESGGQGRVDVTIVADRSQTPSMWPRSAIRRPVEVTVSMPHWPLAQPPPPTPPSAVSAPPPAPPEGISPFSARVLDQLSLTAWLPAGLVVANTYLVIGMYLVRDPKEQPTVGNLEAVVAALNDKPIGVILAVLFGVVLVTLITQSLEFAAIRFLEGYWGGSVLAAVPTRIGVGLQTIRLRLMDRRASKLESKAFDAAEERVRRDLRESPDVMSAVLLLASGRSTAHLQDDVVEAAGDYYDRRKWLRWAPAHLRHRANSLYNRRSAFPRQRSRLMPTRLGNALRSAEDELRGNAAGSKMRGYLYQHLDPIGPALMHQHNQYRNRLDMYAVMTAVSAVLLVVNAWLLPPVLPGDVVTGVCIAFGMLSYLSYRGAIAAALDYGPILLAMDKIIAGSPMLGSR